jgi:hypothetical protein
VDDRRISVVCLFSGTNQIIKNESFLHQGKFHSFLQERILCIANQRVRLMVDSPVNRNQENSQNFHGQSFHNRSKFERDS